MVNFYIYYNTHTHTHTHTYIYIYIFVNIENNGTPVLTGTEIYHFTGQTDIVSGMRLTPLCLSLEGQRELEKFFVKVFLIKLYFQKVDYTHFCLYFFLLAMLGFVYFYNS